MAALSDNSLNESFESLSSLTDGGVIVDIGTGDGRFVYRCARENPNRFYLGIDPNAKALEKISMKATRKPAKGGAANLLFIQAAIEHLLPELNSVADEIHIHFPWGSLLRAIAKADRSVLDGLHRIAAPACLLEVVIGIDPERDCAEIKRLGLPELNLDYLGNVLVPRYRAAGFNITERGHVFDRGWKALRTSWARRLSGNDRREVVYFVAEAQK